jgi:hypothetical protein
MTYYQERVRAKLAFVVEDVGPRVHIEDALPEHAASLLGVVSYLRENIHEVVVHIHDLWCANMLSDGYRYEPVTDRSARVHALLIPYEELPNRALEDQLAVSDLAGFEAVLRGRFGFPSPAPGTRQRRPSLLEADRRAVQRLVKAFARDDASLHAMARNVHGSWCAAQRTHGVWPEDDSRTGCTFEELDGEAQRITLRNAQLDILALVLFLEPL